LRGVDFAPRSNVPALDVEQYGSPEKIASTVRSHWGVPSGPIKNLTRVAERAGVIVGTSAFGGASVSGATFRVPIVLLNELYPADRMRFTLAHELGHLVMHRFPTPDMESEANQFASAILMPENEIRAAFRGRKITLEVLAALKLEWKVAMQALLMRVSALGLIEPNQSRYLWQKISARGWKLKEPPELEFPQETPRVLPSIIKSHLEDLGYSKKELAGLLRIYEDEFEKMYGMPPPHEPLRPRLRVVG
jgi:Zn-dependent peptidase ImmA (M78 family)